MYHSKIGLTCCYRTTVFYIFSFVYLNPRPIYKYGRHVGILHSVSTLVVWSSAVCNLVSATKFHIKPTTRRHTDLSRWRPRRRKSTSGFAFGDVTHLRTSRSICRPNVDKLAQSMAKILLFSVLENKQPPYWNSTSDLDFDLFFVIGISIYMGSPNFTWIGPSALAFGVITS